MDFDFAGGFDDGDGAFFMNGMDQIQDEERKRTHKALLEMDSKLYSTAELTQVEKVEENPDDDPRMRRFDTGYSAHTDGIDTKELHSWRTNFNFISIQGIEINSNSNSNLIGMNVEDDNNNNNTSSSNDDDIDNHLIFTPAVGGYSPRSGQILSASNNNNNDDDGDDDNVMKVDYNDDSNDKVLAIKGLVMKIYDDNKDKSYEEDEEILAIHGSLEEIIEIHAVSDSILNQSTLPSSSTTTTTTTSIPILDGNASPTSCKKAEVISMLFDTIWNNPSFQDTLKPLVDKTIDIANKHSIVFQDHNNNNNNNKYNNKDDSDTMIFSDNNDDSNLMMKW